jgi:hypothetical protein
MASIIGYAQAELAEITQFFNLELAFTEDDLISLLFYMGWITIQNEEEGMHRFIMPNRVISELYYDYFVTISQRKDSLNSTILKIRRRTFSFDFDAPKV